MTRTYPANRAPTLEWLASRCAANIAAIGSVCNLLDYAAAANEAFKLAYDAMALKNGMSGISVDQFFREKVEQFNRLYSTRMNPPKVKTSAYVPERSEYERQSRG